MVSDAHWLYPLPPRNRPFQTCSDSRNVRPPPASAGTSDEASRACPFRGPETAGCCGSDGELAHVHGDERCGEGWGGDNDELYAWGDEEAGEDKGGVSESAEAVEIACA